MIKKLQSPISSNILNNCKCDGSSYESLYKEIEYKIIIAAEDIYRNVKFGIGKFPTKMDLYHLSFERNRLLSLINQTCYSDYDTLITEETYLDNPC